MKRTKDNHFVPQCYIKNWETNGKVWCVFVKSKNKNPVNIVPKKIGFECNLYSQKLENIFANFYDPLFKNTEINENDKKSISKMIGSLWCRHPDVFSGKMKQLCWILRPPQTYC